jgi:hypothetical protein
MSSLWQFSGFIVALTIFYAFSLIDISCGQTKLTDDVRRKSIQVLIRCHWIGSKAIKKIDHKYFLIGTAPKMDDVSEILAIEPGNILIEFSQNY